MLRRGLIMMVVLLTVVGSVQGQRLQAPAERNDYSQGGTMYEPLMEFVYELESQTELMNVQKLTETLMGRDVVMCILADPPIFSPGDIDKSGKPVVLIVNNVHGGEVAGKDASLELMRDMVFGDMREVLKDVVVLNIPTVNPDGAEARRRTNEQGFDMNRDYIKLETQEINALITKVVNVWHPEIHIDTHHGGSAPYVITYQTCMNPAGDAELIRYANEEIVPEIRAKLRGEDYDGFWYSGSRNLGEGRWGWSPTSVEPRKQHVYSTLANMIGFLFETPGGSHRVINNGTEVVAIPREERYKHQVRGEYLAQRAVIEFAAANGRQIKRVVGRAKARAIELGNNDSDNDQIPIAYEQVPKHREEFWVRSGTGFELVEGDILTKWQPTETVTRPWGYLMPPQLAKVVPLLMEHEISVKRLTAPVEVEVEVYYAQSITHSQYFQGHYLKAVDAEVRTETMVLPAGSFFVPAGQQKSNLLCYILEPETNDNLITWNFLDDFLRVREPRAEQVAAAAMGGLRGVQRTGAGGQRATGQQRAGQRGQRAAGQQGTQRGGQRASGQRVPIYRLMKKTNLQGVLVQPYNQYDRVRFIRN
ncbi:MAG: M14 family metallopeptidase [Planctomycetes bacterium]|nr:M14 family metallopeptidase [Planctomycetota bacterium]